MKYSNFTQYFGGRYMKYWYVAFALVMIWFVINLLNNSVVSRYHLTAYDSSGKVVGSKEVRADSMSRPERLPISKSYEPIKPIKFLN